MLNPDHTRKCIADAEAMLARLNARPSGSGKLRELEIASVKKMRDQLVSELAEYESNIRIEDRPCRCKDPQGFACFQCDDYARSLARAVRPDTCTCTELNGEDFVCIECHEHAQALESAKCRNQVDADGNVRIGIADFQPRFLVTDENK